jgi:tetratricopeptide (TPR) repeat protein
VIALLAFSTQLLLLIRFSQSTEFLPDGSDMQFYSDWGRRIASGQLTDGKAFYGLPGYAYLLAAFYRVLGFDPFTIGLVQAVLFSLTAVLIYRVALLAFGDYTEALSSAARVDPRVIGWLAALGWIFFVPAQTFATILMPTSWAVCGHWACVAWLMRTRHTSWRHPWFALGLVIGLLAMLVATVLFLLPVALAAIWRSVSPEKPWSSRIPLVAAAAATCFVGVIAGTAPAWLHNRLIAREPVMLSAHGGINLWIGNNPTATGYPKMPPGIRATQQGSIKDSISLAEAAAGRQLTRAEVSAFWASKAKTYIASHFGDWLALLGRKLVNFWNAYEYDDVSTIGRLRENGVAWPGLRFGLVATLGLAGMIGAGWRGGGPRWIAAVVLLHMLALMPVFVTERYRLIAVPGLLLFAAWWMVAVWEQLASRRAFRAVALAGTAAAAAWFCSIPQADASLWSLDHYDAGLRALKSRDLQGAQTRLESALRYAPRSADIHFAIGNLWLERGDRTLAKSHYRRALELNPRHDGVLNNLGVLALEEKRWELAERFFAAALLTEPNDAKTHFLLATTRLEQGDRAGALKEAERAVELAPRQPEFTALLDRLASGK